MMSPYRTRPTGISMGNLLMMLLMMLVFCQLFGCAHRSKPEMVTFYFKPAATANDGQPVYVVIRQVNPKQFLLDGYDDIAHMVYADPSDKSLLAWHMLIPGRKKTVQIIKPEKTDIAVYALFTTPGDHWKVSFQKPLKSKYKLFLDHNILSSNSD